MKADGSLEKVEGANAEVRHKKGVTSYEIAVPMKPMYKELRPTPGRAYNFSMLVYDQAGFSDLGAVMNLPARRQTGKGLIQPKGKEWKESPFDADVEFGFCSSIH